MQIETMGEARPTNPRRYSEPELNRFGVNVEDRSRVILSCQECGQGWSPNLLSGGRLPRGYWKCPRGCNAT